MEFRIQDITDSTLAFNFSNSIDEEVNKHINILINYLNENDLDLLSVYPTYNSLIVTYNPLLTERKEIIQLVEKLNKLEKNYNKVKDQILNIPVNYGGKYGEDLEEVSKILSISEEQIIDIHSSKPYYVFMIGFSPGFPYLGGLDKRLECPRLPTPRVEVPAGSVAIADRQTGIYPFKSSGGWRIIGNTNLKLFDKKNENPSLIKPGIRVKFTPL
ncbi:MAG: 5-oxoprolinase subunit PxpB [Dehalococcoidia bacterium]|nr:allophanate hydrolase [Chloroflexota bacterium]MBE32227.1 allophanate hydrolase [Rickettsiales bacterium]|tara:strand:+ start:937 stop:1581 length:645 start_codon:yes stop_codon:yes gene_type:complete